MGINQKKKKKAKRPQSRTKSVLPASRARLVAAGSSSLLGAGTAPLPPPVGWTGEARGVGPSSSPQRFSCARGTSCDPGHPCDPGLVGPPPQPPAKPAGALGGRGRGSPFSTCTLLPLGSWGETGAEDACQWTATRHPGSHPRLSSPGVGGGHEAEPHTLRGSHGFQMPGCWWSGWAAGDLEAWDPSLGPSRLLGTEEPGPVHALARWALRTRW